jgi:tetratricopeptide (TPR) repeat protein
MHPHVLVLLAFAAAASPAASRQGPPTPTFVNDIAPLIRRRCLPCHRTDGDAPFPLTTYADVRRRARQIGDVTAKRIMPPWKPALDSPPLVADRRLTGGEIALIARWVNAGAPEGQPTDAPVDRPSGGGWLWGEPDLVLTLPTYTLRADGLDVFRNFVVTVPGSDLRFVQGFQFRPGSRAVHHANIRVDSTTASRALDDADPDPGYEGVILHSADYPDGHFLGWTPGQAPAPSDELAWTLKGGTDLVIQLHMRPTGRVEQVAPRLGLYFTATPPTRTPTIVRLGRQSLDIPAGSTRYRITDSFVLPVDAQVVSVQPHAHNRARDVAAWATLPDGSRRSIIHIADWDFAWQDVYRLLKPFWLPAGTKLEMTYQFDNSEGNPRNPSRPPERATWGWRTSDEMGDVWIQLFTRTETDRQALTSVARRKMTEEDAIGCEVLIAREPNHVNLRNDAALIYQELGQPERALVHFSAVVRLEPQSPTAHYNEGVVLEALGRDGEAAARYLNASRLDPSYARAHLAYANLLYRTGKVEQSIAEYRAGLRLDAGEVMPRCSLARALTETGRPEEAIVEYRAAIALKPDSVPCLINFAWLLSAHADASVRQPVEAVQVAERVAALTRHASADALDVLGAAYASAGRFDDAVRAGTEAIRLLDRAPHGSVVNDIRARVNLYRRHVAFVVPDR